MTGPRDTKLDVGNWVTYRGPVEWLHGRKGEVTGWDEGFVLVRISRTIVCRFAEKNLVRDEPVIAGVMR